MSFMRIQEADVSAASSSSLPVSRQLYRWTFLHLPLWICLLFALLVRIWLVLHTHGVIEGDEALVGIQAEHILRGEHPIYYYGQPYMGSLEAYLLALLFALAGPSVETLRVEPILLSLVVVWLTWKLADALAKTAKLSSYGRQWFKTTAALFAALPPLYDVVLEMRTYGGYVETFILMLLLLLSTLRLTQRWHAGASAGELALRWAGIGFVIGLGMWVYPLIIMTVLAIAIWIVGYCATELVNRYRQGDRLPILYGLLLAGTALPASLIGFAPALYWGANHHWENIAFLLQTSNGTSGNRLALISQVTRFYARCTALRIVGGAVPTESYVTAAHPHFLTPGLVVGLLCLTMTILVVGLSFFWRSPLLLQARKLAGLPLLFATCTAFIFCISSISTTGLIYQCGPRDLVGRYATPLMLALPFLCATVFTVIVCSLKERDEERLQDREHTPISLPSALQTEPRRHFSRLLQWGLGGVVFLCLCAQGYTYIHANAGYLFQTSGCVIAPADYRPILTYMQREHIHYAWATGWVANPITFATNGDSIVVDPRMIAHQGTSIDRIPAYTSAVIHADRPSVLLLVPHNDSHPPLLKTLAVEHITYRVARFPSQPGVDLLVVIPLNRSIPPTVVSNLDVGFGHC